MSREHPVAVIENRVIAPGGTIRWQQWTNRLLFDDQGRIVELQSIGRDITDRKAAEEKLQESEEKYRLLIENVEESIRDCPGRYAQIYKSESSTINRVFKGRNTFPCPS